MFTRVFLLFAFALALNAEGAEEALTFERDIRPILKAHCFDCHGEGDTLRGGLDLRLRRFIVRGGETGPGLVPGDAETSLLVHKVRSGEMPKREKKLTPEELDRIVHWVTQGAETARPEPESIGEGIQVTEEERAHWAFQPIKNIPVPKFGPTEQVRTPIDAFLLREMDGLSFSTEADRVTLIRRASLDLLGFPPSPEEVAEFVDDESPDAYERLLERLLGSPRYGERWARHWLDVAGYADSEGYTEADGERAYAYKYRDFVIRAFNDDKPFNQFVVEQLAGDELALARHKDLQLAVQDPEALDQLSATGYLRMCADGTGGGAADQDAARNAVVADTIKIVSTSLLGLSVGCAQCHDHRYDPIPQRDYYRLRAVFEPAYDWKSWRNPNQRAVSLQTEEERARAEAIEAEAKKLSDERNVRQTKYLEEALEEHLKKFEEALREPLRSAYRTPADKRTPEQKQLLANHPSVNIHPGVLYQYNPKAAEDLKTLDAKITEVRSRKPVVDYVRALTEPAGHLPVTQVFHRGDHTQPRAEVSPGALSVLTVSPIDFPPDNSELTTSGRRLAFARWLTGPENPLLARVIVNRVWMHHFGRGLVGTPSDFGLQGERPTHPALLDWLARAFISPGAGPEPGLEWSLKQLHKLIMTSCAYRQSSARDPQKEKLDPGNRLYWRKLLQRLDAEILRDSILAVSGAVSGRMYGPPVPVREDVTGQIVVGVDKKEGDSKMPVEVAMGGEEFRRSVYIQVRRSRPLALLNVFDAPVMEVSCERRSASTSAPQSLMLMNSQFMLQQAGIFADRLLRETGPDPKHQIRRAWQLAFCRLPTERETVQALEFLDRQLKHLQGQEKENGEKQALTDLCQSLLSANEFLYVD